ncbi:MAG: 50S ribosomal protein L25 [Candidatus Velthaea sp.]
MAKSAERSDALTIETRENVGSTAARAARRSGKIPGILYGHGDPTPIAIDVRALESVLSGGRSRIVDATLGGKHDSVLVRTVQRDPVTHRPIHVDLQRVSKGEAVTATLPIVTTGIARGVRDDGAVMDTVTRQIDVKGPADRIPENITIDVSSFGVHTHVSAGDVALPSGFTLLTPPDTVLVSIEASRTAQQAESAAPAEVAADIAEPAATPPA